MKYVIFAVTLACLLTVGAPAYAQESTAIDISPIIESVLGIVSAVLGVVAIWAARWFKKKTQIDIEATLGASFQIGVTKGIDFAVNTIRNQATAAGLTKIQIENEVVKTAASYAIAAYPQAAASLGISPQRVAELVRARLLPETVTLIAEEANDGDPNMVPTGA